MSRTLCPGQDMRFWRPEDIFDVKCATCGHVLEFFKDEARRICPRCGTTIRNPKLSLGCAQWCEHARECLGFDPAELEEEEMPRTALVDRLVMGMRRVFVEDGEAVDRAFEVLGNAREIMEGESADPKVVMAAAVLHGVDPGKAVELMEEAGMEKGDASRVLRVMAGLASGDSDDSPEFRVVWDARALEAMEAGMEGVEAADVEGRFLTGRGRKLALERIGKRRS